MAFPPLNATATADLATSIPKLWAKLILRDQLYGGFFRDFVGPEGSGKPIIQKTELLNNPGDTIHLTTGSPLAGAGVTEEAQLIGNEEKLALGDMTVVPALARHAVAWNRRVNKKSIAELRSEARMRLAEWGIQKMDTIRIANFVQTANLNGVTYTPNTYAVGGVSGAGTVDSIVAANTLSTAVVQAIKLKLYINRCKPLIIDGQETFGLLVHPNTLYDLKREAEYRDWVRDAEVRGKDNPFFRGATAMIDGVVLFQHTNVPAAVNANGVPTKTSKNIAFGAEAFVEGWDENVRLDEETFDYGMQYGVSYSFSFQPRRALPQNSMVVYAAAVDK